MTTNHETEHIDTVIIGAGQAGLAAAYHLTQIGGRFVILDANPSSGDSWRHRWDSLRLFTPAKFSSLPGMQFSTDDDYSPTKDEMADYLEHYAARFAIPIRHGLRVDTVSRAGDSYLVQAGNHRIEATNVIVATGPHHRPRLPQFADELDPAIHQVHSSWYRNPGQLPDGPVLVVGAGNSGGEIALELAASRPTWLSGRDTGRLPGGLKTNWYWKVINEKLTVDTKGGQRMKERIGEGGDPRIRIRNRDYKRAGIERVPRTESLVDGKPQLADGRVLNVASVIWATGFDADFGWIDLPGFGDDGLPAHYRGVVADSPGLYFVGLPFQYTLTSALIGGVGADAAYVVEHLDRRLATRPIQLVA